VIRTQLGFRLGSELVSVATNVNFSVALTLLGWGLFYVDSIIKTKVLVYKMVHDGENSKSANS